MDPNVALYELRKLVKRIEEYDFQPDAERFAELFGALDEWLSHGGFEPSEWTR